MGNRLREYVLIPVIESWSQVWHWVQVTYIYVYAHMQATCMSMHAKFLLLYFLSYQSVVKTIFVLQGHSHTNASVRQLASVPHTPWIPQVLPCGFIIHVCRAVVAGLAGAVATGPKFDVALFPAHYWVGCVLGTRPFHSGMAWWLFSLVSRHHLHSQI